jgi:hypothetical protein
LDHLKAELEVRGLWECAKKLPELDKRCYEKVREVVESCKRGDCFVDPQRVVEEFATVRVKDGPNLLLAALAVGVIVEALAIVALFLYVNQVVHHNQALLKEIEHNVRKALLRMVELNNELAATRVGLTKKISELNETIDALRYVIYLLGK